MGTGGDDAGRMARTLAATMVLAFRVACVTLVPAASAHGAGGPTTANGTFVLGKVGSPTAIADQFLSGLGLTVTSGDLFHFSWESDAGVGPPINFEIHRHIPTYVVYHNSTTNRDNGTWSVPGTDTYMVFWKNPNNESKLVAYSFVVNHGFDYVLYGGMLGVVAVLTAGVLLFCLPDRRGRGGGGAWNWHAPETPRGALAPHCNRSLHPRP